MSEPDPFASPYHQVHLPGEPKAPLPPGHGWPAPMPSADGRDVPLPRPATITGAFWSWIAGSVLVVLVLPGLMYTGLDLLAADIERDSVAQGDPVTPTGASFIARFVPVMVLFGFAVLSVPYVIAAFKLRSGRNWARVLLAVLGGFGVVFALLVLLMFASGDMPYVHWGVGFGWSLAHLAACLLGLVTMFLPPSNAYVSR
ncbi:hypothetical protein [Saccharothrix hoggarensis]|uniref:Uncharacterized protein n=1 Tax=Saccharothrix hoggarensis TaxID=913853 RepID=A0ABW3QQ33_9PSEU